MRKGESRDEIGREEMTEEERKGIREGEREGG